MEILSTGSFGREQPECPWAIWAQSIVGRFIVNLLRGSFNPLASKAKVVDRFLKWLQNKNETQIGNSYYDINKNLTKPLLSEFSSYITK